MKKTGIPFVVECIIVLAILAPCFAHAEDEKTAALEGSLQISLKYLLYLPKDYDKKASWPLMLFLHGKGERGDDLSLVKDHGPPKLLEAGRKFPFIVLAPQCPSDKDWVSFELKVLLDSIVEKYKVDQDRIYVTGLSMGGFETWRLAAYQPDRFAAIAPICGGGDPSTTSKFSKLPVWAFHGAKDSVITLSHSEVMVESLRKNGGKVKFTVYPEADHDCWTVTYENPQLYKWLLEQKRPKKLEDKKGKDKKEDAPNQH
jgi:predicted peptidase